MDFCLVIVGTMLYVARTPLLWWKDHSAQFWPCERGEWAASGESGVCMDPWNDPTHHDALLTFSTKRNDNHIEVKGGIQSLIFINSLK